MEKERMMLEEDPEKTRKWEVSSLSGGCGLAMETCFP